MNSPKCDDLDYIHFLIAAQKAFTCTEAARCQPEGKAPAHDAFTRLLRRRQPDTEVLWREAKELVNREAGLLVLDDITLDKPYARNMELVTYHWSGKHQRVVRGINLQTLLWTDGKALIPCDFRVYAKAQDGKDKNDHFQDMLGEAKEWGFQPGFVLFDSWYASLENLKKIRGYGLHWLMRLKSNRLVNPDGKDNVPIKKVEVPPEGKIVHLRGYGFIKVFRIASQNGDEEYGASDDLQMDETTRDELEGQGRDIEVYHRGIKQCCGIERAQVRKAVAQKNHFLYALRAFLRLEVHKLRTGISWYQAKLSIIREAIRAYLTYPAYSLVPNA